MEGMEGLELLSYVKQVSPSTEVIIMTAYGTDEMREDAGKRGLFNTMRSDRYTASSQ